MAVSLDGIDHMILESLRRDGRATHAAIGRELGLTGPAVYARIRRMEEGGVIQGYRVDVDPASLGRPVLAFIRVTTRPQPGEHDLFESMVANEPRVLECHDVDGEDSYLLKASCASPVDLRELLIQIRSIHHVVRTVTSIVLETVKK